MKWELGVSGVTEHSQKYTLKVRILFEIESYNYKTFNSNSFVFPDCSWSLFFVEDPALTGWTSDHVPGFQVDFFKTQSAHVVGNRLFIHVFPVNVNEK